MSAARANNSKPRLVILNQYYVPDVASTGHLLHELAAELASQGWDVSVITSRPSYGPRESWQPAPRKEVLDGVRVHRMWTTRFSKDNLLGRACNYLTFFGQLFLRMLFGSNRNVVYLYTTNPPFLGVIGAFVSIFRRHTYVKLLHDAYPQLAVWVGTIRKDGLAERVWHWINKLAYGRATHNIVLCKAAKRLVADTYGIAESRIHVIPNWADEKKLIPKPKPICEFAKSNELVGAFTVLYSGNLGLYYEFDTILGAAERLKDENFRLVFVGSGGRKGWITEQIKKRGLINTRILPYQPFEKLNDSLNSCDASLVTIASGIEGISFPSKLYSSLAVGKPILALSEEDSELRELVRNHDLGVWAALGDADALADGIRGLIADPQRALRQGENCRNLFLQRYTRSVAAKSYGDVFKLADPRANRDERARAERAAAAEKSKAEDAA
ncbi:MAG: glycosyltransferase family 4 protein [Phycisphaerales bacterium]|nr:glycosyltransferase family 4 protein [Phycisphaerales bacterium]